MSGRAGSATFMKAGNVSPLLASTLALELWP